jgi:hypothetical protein
MENILSFFYYSGYEQTGYQFDLVAGERVKERLL